MRILTRKEFQDDMAKMWSEAVHAEYKAQIEAAVLAERQWLIDSGLIGVLKHCEDLLREDGHEDAVNDVQNMIAKIKARRQA